MNRSEMIEAVDVYMAALASGDYSDVAFAPHVNFFGPLIDSPIQGKARVIEFLEEVSEGVKDVIVQEYIIEGSTACVLIQFETMTGDVLPILDYIRFDEVGITYIQPFFDPRPLIEGD